MSRRVGFGLLIAVVAYVLAAAASYYLLQSYSSNTHDLSIEAAMTSAFVFVPGGAVVGFIVGCIVGGRRATSQVEHY